MDVYIQHHFKPGQIKITHHRVRKDRKGDKIVLCELCAFAVSGLILNFKRNPFNLPTFEVIELHSSFHPGNLNAVKLIAAA